MKSIRLSNIYLSIPFILFGLTSLTAQDNRTINGTLNNPDHPAWGSAGTNVVVHTPNAYGDGISTPSGADRPNPRYISNEIFAQHNLANDPLGISSYAWAWGQFIDHDVTLSPDKADEDFNVQVPVFDPFFDPLGTGNEVIPMRRSDYDRTTGTDVSNPRVHFNGITSFIDGSNVYGSDEQRATWLRTFSDGKLKTSAGNLLPYNTLSGEESDAIDPAAPGMAMPFPHITKYFIAGDIRANENPFLTSMHTIFVREHNRLCEELKGENPGWSDEQLYQRARKIVGALIQAVVYEEWLPTLGMKLAPYQGYDKNVQPGIMNVFSTAAYRYGHTTINDTLVRMDDEGNYISGGNISLKDAFFNPAAIPEAGGIEPYLIGMATVVEQDFDCQVIDALRNFLFGEPGSGGLDLVSLNINRGRDRGLADFNTVRAYFGLGPITSFEMLTSNPDMVQRFTNVYGDISKVDPWVGMLAEDHMNEALFGPTSMTILKQQFLALRNGDRFFYIADTAFTPLELLEIKHTLLSDILRRNTGIHFMQDSVFMAKEINTSIADNSYSTLDITLYPNPATDRINISIGHTGFFDLDAQVQLIDMYGRVVFTKVFTRDNGHDRLTIELDQSIAPGIYQARILSDVGSATRTFVKINE